MGCFQISPLRLLARPSLILNPRLKRMHQQGPQQLLWDQILTLPIGNHPSAYLLNGRGIGGTPTTPASHLDAESVPPAGPPAEISSAMGAPNTMTRGLSESHVHLKQKIKIRNFESRATISAASIPRYSPTFPLVSPRSSLSPSPSTYHPPVISTCSGLQLPETLYI